MKNMNKEEKLMDKKISASYEATKTNEEINDKRFENTPLEYVIMTVLSIFILLTLFGIWYLLRKSGSVLAYSKNDYVYYFKFEDILSHDLNISKNTAEKCLRSKNIEENFSQDEMETVLKVKDSQTQQNIIDGLKKGKTINQASASIKKDKNLSKYEKLTKEKARLEKTIQHLEERLEIVSEKLSGM